MKKKCLLIYSSRSGNTEKVANRIKAAFEKENWLCESFKITDGYDVENPPFVFHKYDFLCVGSPVFFALPTPEIVDVMRLHSRENNFKKVVPGPRKAAAFSTYGGAHLGPREAEACLTLLEIEFEHLGFQSAGRFSCPGKYVDYATPEWYHGDIRHRPDKTDLDAAEMFIKSILKKLP